MISNTLISSMDFFSFDIFILCLVLAVKSVACGTISTKTSLNGVAVAESEKEENVKILVKMVPAATNLTAMT